MGFDGATYKSHATVATVVVVMIAAAAGCWAFFVSLRPCRLRFEPGQLINYTLRAEYAEQHDDGTTGTPRIVQQDIVLLCIGQDNEVALVSPDAKGRDEITILDFASDGASHCHEDSDRVGDVGKALGFFDFNLLPLPPGTEQSWNVSLVYSALPEHKRQVHGKVRRISNSSRPEFQLKLPTAMEWVNASDRYQQIRDLTCTYRFNTGKGIVETASVRCMAGAEREDGRHQYRVKVDLELASLEKTADDTAALRDLALATAEAQTVIDSKRVERLAPLMKRIAQSPVADPRLRAIAQRLTGITPGTVLPPITPKQEAPHREQPRPEPQPQPETAVAAATGNWALQVVSTPIAKRSGADALAKSLQAAGIQSSVRQSGQHAVVYAGPFVDKDPNIYAAICRLYGKNKPIWVKWKS